MGTDFDRFAVGTAASLTEVVTGDRIAATAQLTGDDNPIHVDADKARVFGQSQPIAHGVILLGLVSRLIGTRLPGPGSIWFDSQFEFLAPVYAGDEVRVTARVAQASPATRVIVLDVEATKSGDAAVLRGRAKVRVPLPSSESTSVMNDPSRTAIVTGASRGIGRAVAERLGASGWRVVVNYRTDRSGADACVAAVSEWGGTAIAIAADLAHDAKRLFDDSQKAFGRVDAIVHCATPPIARKSWLETSSDEFRGYFETFVIGLHELAALAVPGMKERRAGHIVSVLSSAIAEVPPNLAAYSAGKAALLALTRSLAVELGPSNIRVNAVTPSLVLGPQTDALGPAVREGAARRTPLRRLANATDVADAVLFLLDDRASFVSGANLPVTGGLVI
jgi:3-oxoacyl-[acyl-carrier protein] reductase